MTETQPHSISGHHRRFCSGISNRTKQLATVDSSAHSYKNSTAVQTLFHLLWHHICGQIRLREGCTLRAEQDYTPDMHMSWRLYLPALAALNLTSTSCTSSSSMSDTMVGATPGAALATADSAPAVCPSSIFWIVLSVFGLDSSDVAGASAEHQWWCLHSAYAVTFYLEYNAYTCS